MSALLVKRIIKSHVLSFAARTKHLELRNKKSFKFNPGYEAIC